MKKKFARIREINARIEEIASLMDKEQRERTEDETKEYNSLLREKHMLEMQVNASGSAQLGAEQQRETLTEAVRRQLREHPAQVFEIDLREGTQAAASDIHATADLGLLQPLTIGEVLDPVEAELIWTKIGVKLPTGLSGRYEWPVVGDIESTFLDELEEGGLQKIDIDSIAAVQQRVYCGVALSNQSIFNSRGRLEEIARQRIPHAIARDINKMLFSDTKPANCKIAGPLVGKTAKALSALGTKTFKELNKAKAGLLSKGYSTEGMVWVMTESTKAMLEATPKDAGSGIMVVENDRLCGLPVYCTPFIGEGRVCLGDWRYQVCGQFGTPRFIVDPYTGAQRDMTKLVLNTDYGTATLRPDAFELYTIPTA